MAQNIWILIERTYTYINILHIIQSSISKQAHVQTRDANGPHTMPNEHYEKEGDIVLPT